LDQEKCLFVIYNRRIANNKYPLKFKKFFEKIVFSFLLIDHYLTINKNYTIDVLGAAYLFFASFFAV